MGIIIALILAYVIGSLSTSIILSKLLKWPDPRTAGSKNPGATNVLRTQGQKAALFVLLGDGFKGVLTIWIAMLLQVHGTALGIIALAAVIGHCYPVFFKFQGGKGVATGLGAILALSFLTGLIAIIIWVVVVMLTRYVSLASIIAITGSAFICVFFGAPTYFFPLLLLALFVIWRHKENISRLKSGSENKFNFNQTNDKTSSKKTNNTETKESKKDD